MNGDNTSNNLDIDRFALALTNPEPSDYERLVGDVNGDNQLNNLDIDPFANLLTSGHPAAVPEPSSILLAVCGMVAVVVCRVRRRMVG